MKGRLLFALMFAALMALGISSLYELQAEADAMSPCAKAAAYMPALPGAVPPGVQEEAPLPVKALPRSSLTQDKPSAPPCCKYGAPLIDTSYYRAFYQAFHFSDRAG